MTMTDHRPEAGRTFTLPTLVETDPAGEHNLVDSRGEKLLRTAPKTEAESLSGDENMVPNSRAGAPSDAGFLTPDEPASLHHGLTESEAGRLEYRGDFVSQVDDETGPGDTIEAAPIDTSETAGPVMESGDYKRFSLIEPDRRWVMIAAILLLSGILAASLVSSFTSVYAMAAWVGAPPEVQWLPVIILDVAIVGFSWALMVFARRGSRTWTTRLWLSVVTTFSVAANFMHTYDHWAGNLSSPQSIMGVVFSSSIPLMALVATEELIRLVFKRIGKNGEATS